MGKHLVLVGGGHAHLTVLLGGGDLVRPGNRVTLVSPSPYHYYSGMGPGLLAGTYRPQETRFRVDKMIRAAGGGYLEDRAVRIDPERRTLALASGRTVDYDVLSLNCGSDVPPLGTCAEEESCYPVKPIIHLQRARRAILERLEERPLELVVVGGGAAGTELAGNLWRLVREGGGEAKITLVAGSRLLKAFPEKARRIALGSLQKRGVEILEGARALSLGGGRVELSGGQGVPYDFAFAALGVKPCSLAAVSGLSAGDDGGMLVGDTLQSPDRPEIFGGGDCVSFRGHPLAKVGVYAVRQGPVLLGNLAAALEGGRMERFEPQKDFLLILNMGDGRAILVKGERVGYGRMPLLIKDRIDRRFMKKFQVSGEIFEEEV